MAPRIKPAPKARKPLAVRRPKRVRVPRVRQANVLSRLPQPSSVSMAPVNIGNTIRGVESQVVPTRDGVLIRGRDFMFTPIGTGSVETWTVCGGAPLCPAAFIDSTLRQYMQMYNKFRFLGFTAHYLTSSPTSSDGDVLFYYNKNRESVFLTQTSTNLLPFVISDPNTVLGPQWQNHSAAFNVTSDWKSTDYGMTDDPQEYASGDLFLLSRSTTTDSPGYVMFDYIIEFQEHSLIPRLSFLPAAKLLWTNVAFTDSGAKTINTGVLVQIGGTLLDGSASAAPTDSADGDIFKAICDISNSTLGANSGTITTMNTPSSTVATASNFNLRDGTTLYMRRANNGWTFYTSLTAALAGPSACLYSASATLGATTLQFWLSYVAADAGNQVQPAM